MAAHLKANVAKHHDLFSCADQDFGALSVDQLKALQRSRSRMNVLVKGAAAENTDNDPVEEALPSGPLVFHIGETDVARQTTNNVDRLHQETSLRKRA